MFPFLLVPIAALAIGLTARDASTASAQGPATDSAAVVSADAPAVIEFENQGWELATVYAVPQSGLRVRLGQVMAGATARLVVPRTVTASAGAVDIVAVPLARRYAIRSGPVTLLPGDAIRASIPASQNLISVLPER